MTQVSNPTAPTQDPTRLRIATRITLASPPFIPPPKTFIEFFFPASNDRGTAEAYIKTQRIRSRRGPIKRGQPVTLLVGNAQFETASLHIPRSDILLFADVNPRSLFGNRCVLELIRQCSDRQQFLDEITRFWNNQYGINTSYLDLEKYRLGDEQWSRTSRTRSNVHSSHFLNSDERYVAARESLLERSTAFYLIDLRVPAQLKTLGDVLRENGCVIAEANVTKRIRSRLGRSRKLSRLHA